MEEETTGEVTFQTSSDFTCSSPASDGLDDDLFQDLEDLGEVLDELANESAETVIFSETEELAKDGKEEKLTSPEPESSVSEQEKSNETPAEPDKKPEVKLVKPDISPVSSSELSFENEEDELEDGEIVENDDENELEEIDKKKSEIVNKMKRLVKHKIQLTAQRKELIHGLHSELHFDRVCILLKENALLVKAISNQIFRMKPDLKNINTKNKELRSKMNRKETTEDKKFWTIRSQVVSESSGSKASDDKSHQVTESANKFLNKIRKDKTAYAGLGKDRAMFPLTKSPSEDSEKNTITFPGNKFAVDKSYNQPDTEKNIVPLRGSGKVLSLMTNADRMKKIFEKVCEKKQESMPNHQQSARCDDQRNITERLVERILEVNKNMQGKASGHEKFSGMPLEGKNLGISSTTLKEKASGSPFGKSDVIGDDIEFNLKQIRRNVSSNPSTFDISNMSDASGKTVMSLQGRPVDGNEEGARKPKTLISVNIDDLDTPDNSCTKTSEERPVIRFGRISDALLKRLGPSLPADNMKTGTASYDDTRSSDDTFQVDSPTLTRERLKEERTAFYCGYCKIPYRSANEYVIHLESVQHLNKALGARSRKKKGSISSTDSRIADSDDSTDFTWYKGLAKDDSLSKVTSEDATSDLCIAVIGKDAFCPNHCIGLSHPRCYEHAKCLLRSKDDSDLAYSPDLCSVCMEYLSHCDTSVKCCEKVFRMFRIFRKKFGFKFDWNDRNLKDWFFENYRKLQSSNPSEKSSTVPYAVFKQNQEMPSDSVSKEPPRKILAHVGPDDKPVSLSEARKDCSSPSERITGNEDKSLKKAAGAVKMSCDPFCSFITKFSDVEKANEGTTYHSYSISLEENDPFITDICKNVIYLENNIIPSPTLLSGTHAQFQGKNTECQQVMALLPDLALMDKDLCFQIGEHKGYCSKRLLDRYNFTVGLTKSQFNSYAAVRALRSAVANFAVSGSEKSPVASAFHSDLIQSMDYLAKEMVNPLKYYFKLVITDKRRLRRSGFKFKAKDSTMAALVKENIFSKDLFDKAALTSAASNSTMVQLLNTNISTGGEGADVDGVSVLENRSLSLKKKP